MASKVLLDLAMKLSADSAELRREVQKSNESLKSIRENSANTGLQMQQAFAKIAAAGAMVKGTMSQVKAVIDSSMATADRFRQVTDGLAGAVASFNRSVASGNLSGFIVQLGSAYQAAVNYSNVLDDLSKKQLAVTLQDVGLATDVFRLDQIIHAEESSEQQVREALAKKEEMYRGYYERVNKIAIDGKNGLLNHVSATVGRETGATPDDITKAFDYMHNFDKFDAETKAAQEYFDILDKIKSIESMERNIGAIAAPVNVGGMVKQAQEEADRLFGSLDGFSKWLAENRTLIDLVTPMQAEFIEAEKALLEGTRRLEQVMAQITREKKEVAGRFRTGASENPVSGTEPVDITVPVVVDPVVVDWKELKGMTSPGTGDMIKLPEKTMDPKSMFSGYLEEVQRVSEATQQFQTIATGAAQGIASAFVDMAFGAKVSIQDIIKEMMKMISMQMISMLIGNLISGGGSAVSSIGKIGVGSTGNNPLMLSAFKGITGIPKMATGGLVYGPSVVQVGEYPGANIDPEIVSRASDLKRLLGFGGSGPFDDIQLHSTIQGQDMLLISERAKKLRRLVE